MKIEEIEKLTEKESAWEIKEEYKEKKSFDILIKIFSFFSIIFSLSIINELINIGLEGYLVIIFSVFISILIILNEVIKVNKLIELFSKIKTTENIVLSSLSILLSVVVSTYGIYKFLDKKEFTIKQTEQEISLIIGDTTSYYNNMIDSITNLNIIDVEPFKSEFTVYNNQLNQYIQDRDNYKNSNLTYNRDLRDFYIEVNSKIDKANNNIVEINQKFSEYKANIINSINKEKNTAIESINNRKNNNITSFEGKNNIIILLFLFFTLLTEIGIIYIAIKIASVIKYNNNIKELESKLYQDKIKHIKTTKEFKSFDIYIIFIEKLFATKSKGSSITLNEINTICKTLDVKNDDIKILITELRTMNIISEPVRRIGSKIEMDKEESLYTLRKYFEPTFKKY
jgi:DNA-binding Xre family transcriptional regulator